MDKIEEKQSEIKITPVDFDPFAGDELMMTVPSTESQKEIWASVQMGDDANCAFNESISIRLYGRLDLDALHSAFQKLVECHNALRSTFSPDGRMLCVASSTTIDTFPVFDLSNETKEEKDKKFAEIVQQEMEIPFDLEHGPLFRVKISKLSERNHVVVFTAHHIICDGWSAAVILKDLGKFYTTFQQGLTINLENSYQFSEYALSQQSYLLSSGHSEAENYWLGQFKNQIPVMDIPTDRPRPPLRSFNSAREDWVIDSSLVTDLKRTGAKRGCSFFVTILAGFNAFLYRLTGQEDLIVGVPAAGQSIIGKDNLVGHCVNLLPIRSRVAGDQTFTELLKVIRQKTLDAYEHQQYTFGSLLKKLSLPRDPSRIPLVSVLFNIDKELEPEDLQFEGLDVTCHVNPRSYENFELFVNIIESNGKLKIECQYNTGLFYAETIQRRLEEFEVLLTGVVDNPEQLISRLPVLSEVEKRQQLVEWNDTIMDFPRDACLHELFEKQAQLEPDAVAVVFQESQLTYKELDQRSSRLSHYLLSNGVGPDVPVGICIERSVEMVIGLLGILKAGGAYVPLDPEYPKDRLLYMFENSKIKVLLTQNDLRSELPDCEAKVICLDSDWEMISSQAVEKPSGEQNFKKPGPDNLAYIIYTSGSTGEPKGVQVPHGAVVNFLTSMSHKPGLSKQDVLLAVTTLSFDIAVLEIFLPLSVGAKIVLVSRETASDGIQLCQELLKSNATVMQATPSTWRILLAAGWEGLEKLKILCGGERFPQDLLPKLIERSESLWNMYGPTETTVWSTCCQLKDSEGPIQIGRPIGNTQTYILDTNMQPVPIGTPGELFIGGAGVTRGYLNRPDLTEKQFVSDPFSKDPNARLYRTGDLVRYHPDGNIEYHNRLDNQVKVRGFRIELGEIETFLKMVESVDQAAVVVIEGQQGDTRLVAYTVTESGSSISDADLRDFLRSKLPGYMIPQHFVELDVIPLTPAGKIDRVKLSADFKINDAIESHYIAPESRNEILLAKIWQEVLGVKRVSIHDNFFDLGGHSLLATQVISRLMRNVGTVLTLRRFFEKPTVAAQANYIETLQNIKDDSYSVSSTGNEEREVVEF